MIDNQASDTAGTVAPLVEMRGVDKAFGSVRALRRCDFAVEQGRVVGLLGKNGAGKTTIFRLLAGLLRPDAGTVSVFGARPGDRAVAYRIGVTIEGPAFYPWLSGRRNLSTICAAGGPQPDDTAIEDTLERVGLADAADRRVSGYSQGMRQRLALALALVNRPELLILDEPANGLDPVGMADLRDLIRAENDRGTTILLSSHLLHEIEQICDRVVIIDDGRVLAIRDLDAPTGTDAQANGRPTPSLEKFYLDTVRGRRS